MCPENHSCPNRNNQLEQQLADAKTEHEQDTAMHEKDKNALAAAKQSAHDVVQRVEAEQQKSMLELEELTRVHNELKTEHQKALASQEGLVQEKVSLQDAQAELQTALAEKQDTLQQSAEAHQKVVGDFKIATKRIEQLEKQVSEHQSDIEVQVKKATEMCKSEFDKVLSTAKAEHDEDVARHERDMESLSSAKNAARDVIKRVEIEKQQLTDQHDELMQLHKDLQTQTKELEEQLATAKANHEKDVEVHAKDKKALTAAKENAHSVVKRMETEKQAVEAQSAEIKRLHDEVKAKHQASISLTKQLQKEKVTLQAEVERLRPA